MTNPETKIPQNCYYEAVVKDLLITVYIQSNGVQCKAIRKYNNYIVEKDGAMVDETIRLEQIHVHMTGLKKQDGRCWHTKPVSGMIKREGVYTQKYKDTEVSFHLCPSRWGANAGNEFANAVMASLSYNNQEKLIWSRYVIKTLGGKHFSMTVVCDTGPIVPIDEDTFFDEMRKGKERGRVVSKEDEKRLMRRFRLVAKLEPRAHRVIRYEVTVHFPLSVTLEELEEICTASKITCTRSDRNVEFLMLTDYDIFVPKDLSKLDSNGELYPGEITMGTRKQPIHSVGIKPKYQREPEPDPGAAYECHEMFKEVRQLRRIITQ